MARKDVIKFFRNAFILLCLLFIADRAIGYVLEQLFYKQKHGDDTVSIHMLEKADEDIIIMGGSRASHHYNATLIARETGMSCYNGGRDEMTITYINAVLPIVNRQHPPKVLIMDLAPSELSDPNPKNLYQRISTVLLPFSNRHKELLPTIALAGKTEIWKTKISDIYAYNSLIGSSVQNAFTHIGHHSIQGYEPVQGTIDTVYYKAPAMNFNITNKPNEEMEEQFRHIFSMAEKNNTRVIVIISPFYFPQDYTKNKGYHAIKQVTKENHAEFYDFTMASPFLQNPALFYDEIHMNDSGATIYTKMIADIINHPPAPAGAGK